MMVVPMFLTVQGLQKCRLKIDPVRSLARARGASPKDLGEATSNGIDFTISSATLCVALLFFGGYYERW